MNESRGTFLVGLFAVDIAIDYNTDEAYRFLEFLFADLPPGDLPLATRRFEVIFAGRPARMSLWQDERQLYFGQSAYALASILINEIIYDCIINNSEDHALHAAAFSAGDHGILFPGKSGAGKSSLAGWLTGQGYTYLTDELVLLSRTGRIRPFTRPLALKPASFEILARHFPPLDEASLIGEKGCMVPHRSLNSRWTRTNPVLQTIVYPEFVAGEPTRLTRVSAAQSCLRLMACHVNARNIPDHGFAEIAELTRQVTSYDLKYSSFDDIQTTLQPILPAKH